MLIAIPAALAAGACFALAGVFQQYEAASRPSSESLSWKLLIALAKRRLWLVGMVLALVSYGFQSLALAYGPLSLVQPLIISELIFAIPLSARMRRLRLGRREWIGSAAVAIGLVAAIAAADPRHGTTTIPTDDWLMALGAATVISLGALAVSRRTAGSVRASFIALAAGIIMGTQSALLDATVTKMEQGAAAVFTAWQTYLLVFASIAGLLLIQSAYQAGPLSASAPVIDATEPAVAVTIGVVLFGETIRTGVLAGGVTIAGLLVLLAGIVLLDTSPLMAAVHQRAKETRPGHLRAKGG
ncbi:DMT family transporter [Micromonosporaceae bacterium DT55]|uniref:DMT family transporter n=1 Tax=Melissospora conviva TaxID=3388432 RepID=UPI003C29B19F